MQDWALARPHFRQAPRPRHQYPQLLDTFHRRRERRRLKQTTTNVRQKLGHRCLGFELSTSEFRPSQMGVECNAREDLGGGFIIFNGLLAQLVGCWLCFLEVVGWTPTWPVSGGTTAARRERVWEELLRFSHEGFPSIHGLRTMVNAFLPFRPDVTSVRHVIGNIRHRVGFAGVGGTCILDVLHTCHVYWIG